MEAKEGRGKLIIFSAPSGSGKTTIVRHLLSKVGGLQFSVSATTREPRLGEQNGREYHFLSVDDFSRHITDGDFVEYEEVYPGRFYGTLKSEVERILGSGGHVVFDIDVMGGLNIKKIYGDQALAVFVMPPDTNELKNRLIRRGSESEGSLEERVNKAQWEITFAGQFDVVIINDHLDRAKEEACRVVTTFLAS
ncbi:MAG: guanylate kinase [Bacteroidales bacterium]